MESLTSLFQLGQITRGDAVITSMTAKSGSTIVPGDFVKVSESSTGSDPKDVEVEKITNGDECCCVYGIATLGIEGNVIPIVTSGHVIGCVDSTIFTATKPGQCLCKAKNGQCCCRGILALRKVHAIKVDGSEEKTNAYEVKV